jgi:ribosomal protein S3
LYQVPNHPDLRRQFYGIIIELSGRPKGRARTYTFRLAEGTIAPQTYRFRIGFGYGEAFAKIGVFGIKTRIGY